MALAGKRTAAAGGGDATVTTAAGVWGVIDAALVAAGWSSANSFTSSGGWVPSTVLPFFNSTYGSGTVVSNGGNYYQCIKSGIAGTGGGPAGTGLIINDGTVQWRFLCKVGDSDKIYTSTGESGNEKIYVRVYYQTASGTTVNLTHYQHWDGVFGYNRIGPASLAVSQHTFTAGNTVNYAFVADKDSFCGVFNDSANARRVIGGGLLTRSPGTIATYFASNGTVTAGANKTFTFASGNPIAAGYKLGDRVFVVSQQVNASDPHDPTIPLFAAKITGLTTTSITIDQAKETTSAGALIGADPMPIFFLTNAINNSLNNASYCYTNYTWNQTATNLYTSGGVELGYAHNGTGRCLINSAAGELDPNNRTGRVLLGENIFVVAAPAFTNSEVCGIIPKCYTNPRATDALWTIARSVKEATNYDYVVFPANTLSPAGQTRELIGPFAISGSAGFTVDVYKVDSNTWIEAEMHDQISDTCAGLPLIPFGTDRAFGVPMQATQGYPFQGEGLASTGAGGMLFDSEGNVHAWALYMPNLVGQGSDRHGTNQYGISAGEPLPFDSPEAVSGGTGSAFNSGLN